MVGVGRAIHLCGCVGVENKKISISCFKLIFLDIIREKQQHRGEEVMHKDYLLFLT